MGYRFQTTSTTCRNLGTPLRGSPKPWPRGKVAVVKLNDRIAPKARKGEIFIFGAAEELSLGDSCELRGGLMIKGTPSGPQGGGLDASEHPLQGMVLHATDTREEAEAWVADFRTW